MILCIGVTGFGCRKFNWEVITGNSSGGEVRETGKRIASKFCYWDGYYNGQNVE
jgi:hypothetical protein